MGPSPMVGIGLVWLSFAGLFGSNNEACMRLGNSRQIHIWGRASQVSLAAGSVCGPLAYSTTILLTVSVEKASLFESKYFPADMSNLVKHVDLNNHSISASTLHPSRAKKRIKGKEVQEEEEQPVPLKMYEPSSLPITVRRSPRFGHAPPPQLNHHNAASKKSKSPRKSGSITSHNSGCLRRSSRFSLLSDVHPCRVPENEDNANGSSDSGRRRRFTQDDKHSKLESPFAVVQEILQGPSPLVRQSFTVQEEIHRGNDFNSEATLPIASHLFLESPVKGISEFLSSSGSAPRASADVDAEPCFRPCLEDEDNKLMPAACSGPRVSPGFFLKKEDGVGTNLTRLSDETLLRSSPRHSFSLSGAVKIGVKSYFSGLSELLEERPSKRLMTCSQNSDFGRSNEMLLRRSPRFSAPGNGKLTRVFLQLPKSGKQHSSQRPGKENSSANKELSSSEMRRKKHKSSNSLIGDPIPNDEAREKWYWRYEMKSQGSKSRKVILEDDDEDKIVWNVECHYNQAEIDGCIFYLGDCAYIQGDGGKKHVGRIIELFKTTDGENYFRVQWFYRAEDTVMGEESAVHDEKRLFYSTVMNDNPLECIISKVNIVQISPWMGLKPQSIPPSDFYFDMEYCVDYSTFRTLPADNSFKRLRSSSSCSFVEAVSTTAGNNLSESKPDCKAELALLDLFSGCGGMSTGLCLGAKLSCVHLVTRWALDSDKSACQSLKLNHPEAHVRNEAAEDFLELLKEWQKLCKRYAASEIGIANQTRSRPSRLAKNEGPVTDNDVPPDEYEVSELVDVCYGDPDDTGKRGLKFKVHWKGYDSSEDTWEPVEGLSNCQDCIRDFVRKGFKSKILPLPGDVDVICGGPPCQGISGYNRYRNVDSPLDDERNRQIVVFTDIVQFLKPKFVLMENVADILRFGKASLARYALSRLVHMRYQARFGVVAAGCYGIPQFRLRFFMWGAHPSEKLPQFPLPTHDVIVKCGPPTEFERNLVAYDEDQPRDIEKAVVLHDAISDLPAVSSHEDCEQITYDKPPETELQRFLRSTKYEMSGSALSDNTKMNHVVNDHRPYSLTEEDYTRLRLIPKRKGANFRDLPGVVVGSDNVARRDPTKEQTLPSGKPLVPDFALNFEQGKSKRPYGRIWWDETVGTVVTYPDLHSQAVIHPEQDRVLTIRECARLQGFPDYYRFRGTVKERYRQIGNAVAVPVGRALGFALGMAFQRLNGEEPLMKLPPKFSHSTNSQLSGSVFQKTE